MPQVYVLNDDMFTNLNEMRATLFRVPQVSLRVKEFCYVWGQVLGREINWSQFAIDEKSYMSLTPKLKRILNESVLLGLMDRYLAKDEPIFLKKSLLGLKSVFRKKIKFKDYLLEKLLEPVHKHGAFQAIFDDKGSWVLSHKKEYLELSQGLTLELLDFKTMKTAQHIESGVLESERVLTARLISPGMSITHHHPDKLKFLSCFWGDEALDFVHEDYLERLNFVDNVQIN